MARVSGEKVRKLEGVLHEAAGCLSPAHVAALVAHPDAVRSALAVAADVLAMDDGGRAEIDTITGAEPRLAPHQPTIQSAVSASRGRSCARSR